MRICQLPASKMGRIKQMERSETIPEPGWVHDLAPWFSQKWWCSITLG